MAGAREKHMSDDPTKEYPLNEWLEIVRLAIAEDVSEYRFKFGLQRARVILEMEAGYVPPGEVFVFVQNIREKMWAFEKLMLEDAETELKNGNLPKAVELLRKVVVSLDHYDVP